MEEIIPVQAEVVEASPKDVAQVPDLPQELRSSMAERVQRDWEEIIGAQIDLAKGLSMKEYARDKMGNIKYDPETGLPEQAKYYTKAPDRDAGQYLINQVVGKPKENTVIEGKVNLIFDI